MKRVLAFCLLALLLSTIASAAKDTLTAKKLMSASEFKAAGLDKLSEAELQELDKWISKYSVTVYRMATGAGAAGKRVTIEKAINDRTFIIAGKVFEAQTFCVGTLDGDSVQFTESGPGICFSAKFVNLRTGQMCDVWCK